jgi:phosphoglycerate dehydrogenase-like enzyme
MKIVVTNPSGLTEKHLEELGKLGTVAVYSDTTKDNYAERAGDADIAVIDCFLTPVTKELLESTPRLKFFSLNSTGFDRVDIEAVKKAEISASNVPGFSTSSVAELAIGLLFTVARKILEGDKKFREGLHAVDPGTPEGDQFMGFNLEGKTLGVIGLGKIGTRVATIGKGIGMNVIGFNRNPRTIEGVESVSLSELMQRSDAVVLCLALHSETTGSITRELISKMKKTAVFISIASSKLIDEQALLEALNTEAIAGAGLDHPNPSFTEAKNTVVTPMLGYNTHESLENLGHIILGNIQGYTAGKPVNVISS